MEMVASDRWLLPDGVEELLPEDAWRLEQQRRRLVETFHSWGFDLVMPPLVEYLESLLTGAGEDLATRTFTVTDQLSGRLMGIRADMTPQVARIDAHYMHRSRQQLSNSHVDASRDSGVARLCYAGPTLQTLPRTLAGSREPFQFGAELFGVTESHGDCEIVSLMTHCLGELGFTSLSLDLGHVGIFRALARYFEVGEPTQKRLLDALVSKSSSDIAMLGRTIKFNPGAIDAFVDLTELCGDTTVIPHARNRYGQYPDVVDALNNLESVVELLTQFVPELTLSVDLAEIRGYRYHTGIIYSLLAPGVAKPVARGGRYDGVGLAFGRARPATGFSGDLRQLRKIQSPVGVASEIEPLVVAPFSAQPELKDEISKLRAKGYRVVRLMPGQTPTDVSNCRYRLVPVDSTDTASGAGRWTLEAVAARTEPVTESG